jgi:hypothetical protein
MTIRDMLRDVETVKTRAQHTYENLFALGLVYTTAVGIREYTSILDL